MGVIKLWELLLTIAQPYSIQQLSGKVLAIDASIWIVKIDTVYSSNVDKIKSILSKIMLFKRNNILPIFVFDGVSPALKRRTLEQRSRKRLVANQLDAKKKSEIQIMRMIEGDTVRMSEKNRRLERNEEELSQINSRIKNLSDISHQSQTEISNEIIEKIALQSQILNTKYKIMLEILPQYSKYENFLSQEDYYDLDLQSKIEYLDELEEYKWKNLKNERKQNKAVNLTQEEKLRQDLDLIQKKSVIREMQDNLFRKMMQKNMKIQNGFQIIQTVYNGRKVIQKRKVKDPHETSFGFGNMRKGKMKNDMSKINFVQEKSSGQEIDNDPFISAFCNHSQTSNNRAVRQSQKQKIETELIKHSQLNKLEKEEQGKFLNKNQRQDNKNNSKRQPPKKQNAPQQLNQQISQPYIPFHSHLVKEKQHEDEPQIYVNKEQFNTKYAHSQQNPLNKDNFPNFSSEDYPQYLNASNDNVELQNLFKILGLPFLVAPGQAQAQCAALQREGIVDGIVTEDSDTFLFGGKNVFRGVFGNNIRYYSYAKIQQKLKMNRQKLIIFAQLLGSDYAEGVKGIGLVNAMEILKVFNTFDKLQQFKKWAEHPDVFLPEEQKTEERLKLAKDEERQFYDLHKKFKNYWYIGESFGNKNVQNGYLYPDVVKQEQLDALKAKGAFESKQCKEDVLVKLLKQRLELEEKQFEHFMRVLTLKYTKKRPNTLLNYFQPKPSDESTELARIKSKRLQKSLQDIDSQKK